VAQAIKKLREHLGRDADLLSLDELAVTR